MQLLLGDVVRLTSEDGKAFTAYEILLDGVFHSFARYRQLLSLFQELEKMGLSVKCDFPEKSLFPVLQEALLLRRLGLQNFLRVVGSDPNLLMAAPTVKFFAHTRESYLKKQPVFKRSLPIRLPGGASEVLSLSNIETTDTVIQRLAAILSFPDTLAHAFGLFLIQHRENITIFLRKLQRYECPLTSLSDVNRGSCRCEIMFRKCTFSRESDALLLENQIAAQFLSKQAIEEFGHVVSLLEPNSEVEFSIATRAFEQFQSRSDFQESVEWLRKTAPLYANSLLIRSCKVAFSPAAVGFVRELLPSSAVSSVHASNTTSIDPQAANILINHQHLVIALIRDVQKSPTSTPETSPLMLQIPITSIHSWQVVVPEAPSTETPHRLLLHHAPGSYIQAAALEGRLPESATQQSSHHPLNDDADIPHLEIASDYADQIHLLNSSLLDLVDEAVRVKRHERPFDLPATRLPPTQLFPISTFPASSHFSSSVSSLSEGTDAVGQRMDNKVGLGARWFLGHLKRLVWASGAVDNISNNAPGDCDTGLIAARGLAVSAAAERDTTTRDLLIEDDVQGSALCRLELDIHSQTVYNPQDPLAPQLL